MVYGLTSPWMPLLYGAYLQRRSRDFWRPVMTTAKSLSICQTALSEILLYLGKDSAVSGFLEQGFGIL